MRGETWSPRDFALSLRDIRCRRGVSQDVTGGLCGISRNMVSRYENGKNLPTVSALIALADYFGVSVDELLGR